VENAKDRALMVAVPEINRVRRIFVDAAVDVIPGLERAFALFEMHPMVTIYSSLFIFAT
jgi:hypothetical protein